MFILDIFHQHPDILTQIKCASYLSLSVFSLHPFLHALGRWEVAGREEEKEEVGVGGSEREHGLDVTIFYSTAVPGAPGTSTVQLAPKLTFFRCACSLLGTLRQGIPANRKMEFPPRIRHLRSWENGEEVFPSPTSHHLGEPCLTSWLPPLGG